eukprot:CAMPEP_0182418276 /NCGR_PEP_ID=MMETSP1167-20130531/2750_1 /TAXON_ID=2988 /ORGANISM="Mallomonas Sp, Strain CCMP3275" /LENGTH=287 /DNA_ID=CAMNT_0024592417 /DNA_START=128 /DNA_END=991 /DNA_ORIENTATION=-
MGKGMVKNLVTKLSYNLVVYNRSVEVSQEVAALYPGKIEIASTAKEVIERCNITYSMLSTLEASIAVFDSPEGVVAGVTAGKTIIDCATLTPERMVEVEGRVRERGGRFLEAPVSGSKVPAEQGQLIFLCGGDETLFTEVQPALDAMGKAAFLFGPVGQGSRMKLVVNSIMGGMMTVFAEGMTLCEAADLPTDKLLSVLDLGAMACPMYKGKGPLMIAKKYDPNFPLKHQQKDMKFALGLADSLSLSLPVTAAANELYEASMKRERERGDLDFSAVVETCREQKKEK